MLQIDALAHSDFRRALDAGYCPTLSRLMREGGYTLTRWFCGLPSATPYCQAGIMYGANDGIPAFRFYDKPTRRVITCNAPQGVQFIRDRIGMPGALYGGSSYVNLLDGDARTVAFTVATRDRLSAYRRLGGTRMAMLIVLHPIRVARMIVQSATEWVREDWERSVGEFRKRRTHAEGIFPLVRILTNVVVRELQTLAIVLDVHLGVPIIYSTFMQYDELAHHFGPSSRAALRDLRRTDARIAEILRMMRNSAGREYDLVVLSDHGMTPASSYRVRFGETLGATVQRILDEARPGDVALESAAERSEYADLSARVVETVAGASPARARSWRRSLLRLGAWLRREYGLREIIFPEKYHVGTRHNVIVTYSSPLALVYFADVSHRLELPEIEGNGARETLLGSLVTHPGVGMVLVLDGADVVAIGRQGRARLRGGRIVDVEGQSPLDVYGLEPATLRATESLVRQPNTGDLVIFGAYDGYEIVSFDDQIGAHGCTGGDQMYPFLMTPPTIDLSGTTLEDARDIHGAIISHYAVPRDRRPDGVERRRELADRA